MSETKPNQEGRPYRKAFDPDNRGPLTVYFAAKENPKKKKESFDCAQPSYHCQQVWKRKFLKNLIAAGNVLRLQLAFESAR